MSEYARTPNDIRNIFQFFFKAKYQMFKFRHTKTFFVVVIFMWKFPLLKLKLTRDTKVY
jgi:hypothetical protein